MQRTARADPLCRLPSRLLDLLHGSSILIVNVAEWISLGLATIAELSEYCTLSYQWGPGSHDCVLAASFPTLLELSISSMPQKFKDPITVARTLGVRFHWINALCIVQPTALEMIQIGAPKGLGWEPFTRTLPSPLQRRVRRAPIKAFSQKSVAVFTAQCLARSLCTRGTALESPQAARRRKGTRRSWRPISLSASPPSSILCLYRALSKRIIHFTTHGMFWECCESKAHDQYGDLGLGEHMGPCRTKETLLSIARARRSRHLCPVEWFHFIRMYSFAGFTDPSDRLIALSSVARAAQPIMGGHEYCAGLWRNDPVCGLMWHCRSPLPKLKREYGAVAPTWSWASVEGSIDFSALGLETFGTALVNVLNIQLTPVLETNPYGNLREGTLKLLGRPSEMALPSTNTREWTPRRCVFWDEIQDFDQGERVFAVLPVRGCFGYICTTSQTIIAAFILELVTSKFGTSDKNGGSRTYRRIGFEQYSQYRTSWPQSLKTDWVGDNAIEITIV